MRNPSVRPCLASVAALGLMLLSAAEGAEDTARADAAIDARLGLLDRSWVIVHRPSRTRSYLAAQARTDSGLPVYNQDVERARRAPTDLFEELSAPPPPASPPPAPPPAPPGDPVPPPDDGGKGGYVP